MKTSIIEKSICISTEDSKLLCAFNCQFLVDYTNKEEHLYWCTLFDSTVWNRSRYFRCTIACGEVIVNQRDLKADDLCGNINTRTCPRCNTYIELQNGTVPEVCPSCSNRLGVPGNVLREKYRVDNG